MGAARGVVRWYTEEVNNVIAWHVTAYPDKFRGVGLPQSPGVSPKGCLDELERCVRELGFVGCVINPDPGEPGSDGSPGARRQVWYPLYEKMVASTFRGWCIVGFQSSRLSYSLHFINEESIAVVSLANSRVFEDFPTLNLMISHGGGTIRTRSAGSWRSSTATAVPDLEEAVRRLYYDTCLYTKDGLRLLFKTMGADRCLFGTETPGRAAQTRTPARRWTSSCPLLRASSGCQDRGPAKGL